MCHSEIIGFARIECRRARVFSHSPDYLIEIEAMEKWGWDYLYDGQHGGSASDSLQATRIDIGHMKDKKSAPLLYILFFRRFSLKKYPQKPLTLTKPMVNGTEEEEKNRKMSY